MGIYNYHLAISYKNKKIIMLRWIGKKKINLMALMGKGR